MITLRYPANCSRCSKRLAAKTPAVYFRGVVTCEECSTDRSSFVTTHLPDGVALGAEDSKTKPMMTKKEARSVAIARTQSQPPKRKRKPQHVRKRNNTR